MIKLFNSQAKAALYNCLRDKIYPAKDSLM